jgi:hypothetical protein
LKCVLIKEKMLDANGQFVDAEKFDETLNGLVPLNMMDLAAPRLRNCREKFSSEFYIFMKFGHCIDVNLKLQPSLTTRKSIVRAMTRSSSACSMSSGR